MTYVHGPGCVHSQYSLAMRSGASDLLSKSPHEGTRKHQSDFDLAFNA